MGFLRKKFSNFLNFVTYSMFVGECDRNSKTSQNVPKSILIEKLDNFFQKSHEFFKIAKDIKIFVECDFSANITISQKVHFFS